MRSRPRSVTSETFATAQTSDWVRGVSRIAGSLVNECGGYAHRFLSLPNIVVRLDGPPQFVKRGSDAGFKSEVGHELVKVLVRCRDFVHVEAAGDLANQSGQVLFSDVIGLSHVGNLAWQPFLPGDEVGARSGYAGDGTTGRQSLRRRGDGRGGPPLLGAVRADLSGHG